MQVFLHFCMVPSTGAHGARLPFRFSSDGRQDKILPRCLLRSHSVFRDSVEKSLGFPCLCKRFRWRHRAEKGPPEGSKSVARASVHRRPAPPGGPLASRKVHVKTLPRDVKSLPSACGISAKIAGTMAGRRCSGGAARSAAARSAAGGPGRVAVV